jgi:hypothetical protein
MSHVMILSVILAKHEAFLENSQIWILNFKSLCNIVIK